MNRRAMLKWLVGGAALAGAGIVVAPARTIFLPPRGGWIPRGAWGSWWEYRPADTIMGVDPPVGDDYGAVTWMRRELDRLVMIDYRIYGP